MSYISYCRFSAAKLARFFTSGRVSQCHIKSNFQNFSVSSSNNAFLPQRKLIPDVWKQIEIASRHWRTNHLSSYNYQRNVMSLRPQKTVWKMLNNWDKSVCEYVSCTWKHMWTSYTYFGFTLHFNGSTHLYFQDRKGEFSRMRISYFATFQTGLNR